MPRDDEARLLDMLLAARDAREFVVGMTREQSSPTSERTALSA